MKCTHRNTDILKEIECPQSKKITSANKIISSFSEKIINTYNTKAV